jgi:hypothetical protein
MRGFEVRRGGVTLAVPDAEALRGLVVSGGLDPSDAVREVGGDWCPAASHPALAADGSTMPPPGAPARPASASSAADPWTAWSDVDAVDAASLYREMTEDAVEELPVDAMAPVRAPALVIRSSAGDGLEALPEDALAAADDEAPGPVPTPAAQRSAAGPAADRRGPRQSPDVDGKASDRRPSPRDTGAPPMMPDFPRRASPNGGAGASSGARAVRSAGMLVATILLGVGGLAFLRGQSTPQVTTPTPAATAPTPAATPVDDGRQLALLQTEAELRGRLPPVPRPIKEPGALADALMLEMTQLGVSVSTVDANVVKWVGRKQDEPKTVEVRVAYRASVEPSRDIGAIGLVVGRYMRVYRLEVPILEITETSTLTRSVVDSTQTEAWYLSRLPLARFLEAVRQI